MSAILECRNLSKRYGSKEVLAGLDLTLERGRIIGLLGPNGSGKSTLIKLVAGVLTPSAGEIRVGGFVPGIESKKIVSYLPERTYLNDWMTVRQMVGLFADFYDDFNSAKAYDMVGRLKLDPQAKLKTLSKGTREKIQLILVMSREAELYLLDEPIGGVDPAARDYILNTIIQNYSDNAAVILSTHLIADIERILDEVVFLKDGQVTLHSSVEAVREEKGTSIDGLFREVFKC